MDKTILPLNRERVARVFHNRVCPLSPTHEAHLCAMHGEYLDAADYILALVAEQSQGDSVDARKLLNITDYLATYGPFEGSYSAGQVRSILSQAAVDFAARLGATSQAPEPPYQKLMCRGCTEEYYTLEEVTECFESHPQCESCKSRNEETVHHYEDAYLCDDCADELRESEKPKEVHVAPRYHPDQCCLAARVEITDEMVRRAQEAHTSFFDRSEEMYGDIHAEAMRAALEAAFNG